MNEARAIAELELDGLELTNAAVGASIRNQSNSAVLGDVAWLMMGSGWHRSYRVQDFIRLVMPPIGHRQFRLFYEAEQPIAYLSWASLSPEIERRFLVDPASLEPADWTSGTINYLVDFIARQGALRKIKRHLLTDPLLSGGAVRGIRMRNGVRMMIEVAGSPNERRIRTARLD